MGGTAPFNMPGGSDGCSMGFLFFFGRLMGRGEDTRGGGVAVRSGTGGVGIDGAGGGWLDCSEDAPE